jgi:Flp pilus assembly protein TadD
MTVVPAWCSWRRRAVARLADHGHRSVVAGVLVLGLAALAVGLAIRSGALAALGIVLAVPQTVEAGRNLRDGRRPDAGGLDGRRALARRMLAVRRAEELVPSIPGGAVIDLDYLPETELVTFRSQDDRVAAFDELVTAIKNTGGPLVLVGTPGAGKTFTARWVVTTVLDQAAVDDGPLAERFLLSRWDGTPLSDWLPREWARRREYRLGAAEAAELVADPSVVLVLDGLDEVPNAQRQACVDAINSFVDVHPHARLVVCCRNREYRALARRIESRRVRWIAPLDMATLAAFVADHAPAAWDSVRAALGDDQALRSLLSTPLLLVAALRAFRDDPTPLLVGSLTARQHALWDRYVDRMLGGDRGDPGRRRLEDAAITMAATGTLQLARAPRGLRSFLDHSVDRHLLRRSAGGYQCLHRQLLGHLVGRATFPAGRRALRSRVMARVPSDAQAWNNLAREASAAGHHDAAAELTRRALKLEPGNAQYLGDVAFHLLLATRHMEAASAARAAEAADPSDWRPSSTLAYALHALGDLEGSAAARRRAWTNGHHPSEGSFMAYVFTLQGLCSEASSVVDKLRAIDGDSTRMDRAVALAALGRAGEAAEALHPPDIDEIDAAMLSFDVPTAAARPLVPGGAFDLAEPEPGAARLVVFAEMRSRNLARQYHELVFALGVRPTGHPEQPAGFFVTHRFVNKPLSGKAARRTLVFPRSMAGIDLTVDDDVVAVHLRVDGHETLALRVPRIPAPDHRRRGDAVRYSMVGGIPCTSTETFDRPSSVVPAPTAVGVVVGTGPTADMLRSLGLPRAPDWCAWGEGLTLISRLPRPLGGTAGDR